MRKVWQKEIALKEITMHLGYRSYQAIKAQEGLFD